MAAVRVLASLFGRTLPYRLAQAPFAERKFAPVARHNDLAAAGRVLDVACGPGTNARHFAHCEYLGVDINEAYIDYARARYGPHFRVADVTRDGLDGRFDFVLVNSFFHHVDDRAARNILGHLAQRLEPTGHIHILDLVLPSSRVSPAAWLACLDRGDYARPLHAWRALFGEAFEEELFEPYPLGIGPLALWHMVYFKGRTRR